VLVFSSHPLQKTTLACKVAIFLNPRLRGENGSPPARGAELRKLNLCLADLFTTHYGTWATTYVAVRFATASVYSSGATGPKSSYFDVDTEEEYWISDRHKDGRDHLYGGRTSVPIDEDVQEEYWPEFMK